MKGLGFKHHGNHPCNHGSHYGNHHGNYHDNHSNHHGNYHAEQLLFSCQCSKVSSCRVVRLSSCQVRFLGTRDMLNKFFLCPCSNLTVYRRKWQWFLVPCFRGLSIWARWIMELDSGAWSRILEPYIRLLCKNGNSSRGIYSCIRLFRKSLQ